MNRKSFFEKIEICALALILLGCLIYGVLGRFSHTDVYADNMDQIQVAELPAEEDFVQNAIKSLQRNLTSSPYIIKCVVLEEPELIYKCMRVHVKVLKVYEGTDISEGDEFWITRWAWGLSVDEDGSAYFNLGLHNIMQKDHEYLVFMEERLELTEAKYGITYRVEDYIILPVFEYGDHEHVCVSLPERAESTYVTYSEVRDNEFFCASEEVLDQLLQLKAELLELYP